MPSAPHRPSRAGLWLLAGVTALGGLAAAVWPTAPAGASGTTSAPHRGPVHLDGRALADDDGAWNAWGASLFWALWGEARAPDKLDGNLATLAAAGVDAVRILGMVGAQPAWQDRVIDPAGEHYWPTVEALFARLRRHDLRAEVTIFADAQVMMPDAGDRVAFVDRWRAVAAAHADQITFLEVANEAWQNGVTNVDEVRRLGARLAEGPVLVALSAPADGHACELYAESAADLATMHYDRDTSRAGGAWRPHWQPWSYPGAFDRDCPGRLPEAVANNEPIGPGASVVADADPLRLALGLATTYLAGNAVYTLHAGPGIQGGNAAARARGRVADYADLDPAILAALAATHALLPPGLARWTRRAPDDAALPFAGLDTAVADGALAFAPAASSPDDRDLVVALLGLAQPVTLTAREPLRLAVHDPETGGITARADLETGGTWTMAPTTPGALMLVRRRDP